MTDLLHQDSRVRKTSLSMRLTMATADHILRDALKNHRYNSNTNQAAAIAFYAILSLIPLFILTVILLGHILASYPDIQRRLMQALSEIHPYVSATLLSQLGHVEQKRNVLGWAGIISLFWLSAMIFGAIEKALNMIFRVRTYRNYLMAKLLALSMIPVGWGVGIASVGITYGANILVQQSLMTGHANVIVACIRALLFAYLIPYLLTAAFVAVVYTVVPNTRIRLRAAIAGGAIFAVLVEIAKHIFTWYVSTYTRYNVIFGSLETLVVLVIWVFYVAMIFLFCAELVASYERRDILLIKDALLDTRKRALKIDQRLFRKFGRIFIAGERIFQEGDLGREMYYILEGRIRMEKRAGDIVKVLAEMGPGEYFGEMAALIESPRTATAVVMEDSHVAVIGAETFCNLLQASGEVSVFMLREFSHRIRRTSDALEKLDKAWLNLMILVYILQERPLHEAADHLAHLAELTAKEKIEIRLALAELAGRNVLCMQDGRITDVRKDAVRRYLRYLRGQVQEDMS